MPCKLLEHHACPIQHVCCPLFAAVSRCTTAVAVDLISSSSLIRHEDGESECPIPTTGTYATKTRPSKSVRSYSTSMATLRAPMRATVGTLHAVKTRGSKKEVTITRMAIPRSPIPVTFHAQQRHGSLKATTRVTRMAAPGRHPCDSWHL